MKKKEKLIIVILLSLSLSAISTNVLGQTTYTCKVEVGDEFIYTVTYLNTVMSVGSGMSVGDKMKINITDITEETNYFEVEYNMWDMISKGESFNSTPDYSDYERVYKDPSHVYAFIYYFVLTPVSEYLAAFAEDNYDYSSSGNKLIESYDSNQYTSTYDSNGVLSKNEVKMNSTVMGILSRGGGGSEIPGYDLPILIGLLTAIAGVSIIYIVKKKMLKSLP